MPYRDGEKVSSEYNVRSKMTKMIDLAPTGHNISVRLANKLKQKYNLFTKLSLSVVGACGVSKNPIIFLIIENQHIQEINSHFDGTLNHFGPMGFEEN